MSENRRFFDVAANMACRDVWRSTAEICRKKTKQARFLFWQWQWQKKWGGGHCFVHLAALELVALRLEHRALADEARVALLHDAPEVDLDAELPPRGRAEDELGSDDGAELRELRDAPSERVDDRPRRCPALRDA